MEPIPRADDVLGYLVYMKTRLASLHLGAASWDGQPLFSLPARATQGWRVGWEFQAAAKGTHRGSSSPTRAFSEGFRPAVLCLGWKRQVRTGGY